MKEIFNHKILTKRNSPVVSYCSDYLEMLNISLSELFRHESLYYVDLFIDTDEKTVIKIMVNIDQLEKLVTERRDIPAFSSLISLLNMYSDTVGDKEVKKLDIDQLKVWINSVENNCINHQNRYNYLDPSILKLSCNLYYNKNSQLLINNTPMRQLKSYNGGCIIDPLNIKSKKELYTMFKRPKYQTNGTILKKICNGYKINRFITSNMSLLISPPKMQKHIKERLNGVRSMILTAKNYERLTLNDLSNIDLIICSYTFIDSLIPRNLGSKMDIENYLDSSINSIFNNLPKINPFLLYWERVVFWRFDYIFKMDNRSKMRYFTMSKMIESLVQWVFINNKPDDDQTRWIVQQLFRNDINVYDQEGIDLLFVEKEYQDIKSKKIVEKTFEYSAKEQFILQSSLLNSRNMLEANFPLLFAHIEPNFSSFRSIEEIKGFVNSKIYNKVHKYTAIVDKIESGIPSTVDVTTVKNKIKKVQGKLKYFDNLFTDLGSGEVERCPICISDIDHNCLAITKCGHLFCYYCMLQSVSFALAEDDCDSIKCPKCRENLYFHQIYAINNEDDNISEHGTKIGTLLDQMKGKKERILVLSKWGAILKYIKDQMSDDDHIDNSHITLLCYKQLDQLNRKHSNCIMLDQPPSSYKKEKIDYYCDSVSQYKLDDLSEETINNNIVVV